MKGGGGESKRDWSERERRGKRAIGRDRERERASGSGRKGEQERGGGRE